MLPLSLYREKRWGKVIEDTTVAKYYHILINKLFSTHTLVYVIF